jgi:nitrite reductase (NADH) small subunit
LDERQTANRWCSTLLEGSGCWPLHRHPISIPGHGRAANTGGQPFAQELAMTQSDWLKICTVDDIPALGSRVIRRAAGPDVALFRTASDRVFALLDRCPHKGGPLSQGIVHGERVACPLHGFNIELGDGVALPPDEGCTPRFEIRRDADVIYLKRSELASIGVVLDAGDAVQAHDAPTTIAQTTASRTSASDPTVQPIAFVAGRTASNPALG